MEHGNLPHAEIFLLRPPSCCVTCDAGRDGEHVAFHMRYYQFFVHKDRNQLWECDLDDFLLYQL